MDKQETREPLAPLNCTLILINYQTNLASSASSIEHGTLLANVCSLAGTARAFDIPTILTTIGVETFGGQIIPQLRAIFPALRPLDCTRKSIWEDSGVVAAVKKAGRKKLIMAGLWTDFPVVLSAVQALDSGYDVFLVKDACGDLTPFAHDLAIKQLVAAGGFAMTGVELILFLQQGMMQEELTGLTTWTPEIIGTQQGPN